MWINKQTKQTYLTFKDVKKAFPNTGFAPGISNDTLKLFGIYPVEIGPTPSEFNPNTQKLVFGEPVETVTEVEGAQEYTYTITPSIAEYTPEELATLAKVKALALAATNRSRRKIRDNLLLESDWTQLPDSPLTAQQRTAWATYRQQLRDITDLETWPNVVWPQKPQ